MPIKKYLESHDMGIVDLSKRSGVTYQSLWRAMYEHGKPSLKQAYMLELFTKGEISLKDWFSEEETKEIKEYFR